MVPLIVAITSKNNYGSISVARASSLNKEVQVAYPSWDGNDDYLNIQWDKISTVAYSFVLFNSDGSLNDVDSWNHTRMQNLIQDAHLNNVKVILAFGGGGQSTSIIDAMLSNSAARNNLIVNLLNYVKQYNFDGVDADIELFSYENKDNFTLFQQNLFNTFKASNPNYRISFDIEAYYPNGDRRFDVAVLQNYADYILLPSYPWYGAWSGVAGPLAPNLDDPGDCSTDNGNYCTIKHYEAIMDKAKLLYVVPYYGMEYQTRSDARKSPLAGRRATAIFYKDFVGSDGISLPLGYTRHFDPLWQTPWYTYKVRNKWYQGHYEDLQSLGMKYDLVNSEGLGGIAIWEITMGGTRQELWQLIKDKFGFTPIP